jgi:hypothetical protein
MSDQDKIEKNCNYTAEALKNANDKFIDYVKDLQLENTNLKIQNEILTESNKNYLRIIERYEKLVDRAYNKMMGL